MSEPHLAAPDLAAIRDSGARYIGAWLALLVLLSIAW